MSCRLAAGARGAVRALWTMRPQCCADAGECVEVRGRCGASISASMVARSLEGKYGVMNNSVLDPKSDCHILTP